MKGSLGFDTVTGSVVGRESAQFRRVVTVDVGTDHGVKEGDVVVGAGGALVGRVTGVTGNSATILLINDTSSTVIGQLGTNQMTGSIIGQLGGVLIMENIDSASGSRSATRSRRPGSTSAAASARRSRRGSSSARWSTSCAMRTP